MTKNAPLEERFFEKIVPAEPDDCWIWTGAKTVGGYGSFWDPVRKRLCLAHRWIWEFFNGPIPTGLTIDHLCGTRECQNPYHMDIVSLGENVRRAMGWKDGKCKRGHDLSQTLVNTNQGTQRCYECVLERGRKPVAV